jgi:hypothetical protein
MKCKYCDGVYTGGAQRIIKHLVKCHSCPSPVTDWGRGRQATVQARKDEKNEAKKLINAFDGVADDGIQQSIKGSIDKLGLATELCHKEVCNWVYATLQSFNEPGQESFIKMLTTFIKFAPKGYKPPSPFLIRTKYPNQKFVKTQAEMTLLFQDLEHHCALTLQGDGKTNSG